MKAIRNLAFLSVPLILALGSVALGNPNLGEDQTGQQDQSQGQEQLTQQESLEIVQSSTAVILRVPVNQNGDENGEQAEMRIITQQDTGTDSAEQVEQAFQSGINADRMNRLEDGAEGDIVDGSTQAPWGWRNWYYSGWRSPYYYYYNYNPYFYTYPNYYRYYNPYYYNVYNPYRDYWGYRYYYYPRRW